MPQLNQGQAGHSPGLMGFPKLTRINGDDVLAVIYRNMGNNHAYPFVWSETVTVASGESEVTVISGVKLHGMKTADYCNVCLTALADPAARYWVEKDSGANTIKVKVGSTVSADIDFDVMVMVGVDPNIAGIYCRGNDYLPH